VDLQGRGALSDLGWPLVTGSVSHLYLTPPSPVDMASARQDRNRGCGRGHGAFNNRQASPPRTAPTRGPRSRLIRRSSGTAYQPSPERIMKPESRALGQALLDHHQLVTKSRQREPRFGPRWPLRAATDHHGFVSGESAQGARGRARARAGDRDPFGREGEGQGGHRGVNVGYGRSRDSHPAAAPSRGSNGDLDVRGQLSVRSPNPRDDSPAPHVKPI